MGHPVEIFTSPPPDGCICAICHDVLQNAVVMKECGHSFCEECADKTNDICPNCRLAVTGTVPNFTTRSLVGSMMVMCTNEGGDDGFNNSSNKRARAGENGESIVVASGDRCNWTGKCSDLRSHQNVCNLEVITCSIEGCDHRCRRKDMNNHLSGDGFLHHMNLMQQSITARYEKKMVDMHQSITSRYEREIKSLSGAVEDNRRKLSELQHKVASPQEVRVAVLDKIRSESGNYFLRNYIPDFKFFSLLSLTLY